MTIQTIIIDILKALILTGSLLTSIFIVKYLRDYKIFQSIFAKVKGNVYEYDRLRRKQMKKEMEQREKAFQKELKDNKISKLYRMISMTGISEKIPGFSELGLIILFGFITVVLFVIIAVLRNLFVALVISISFIVIGWYTLSLIIYSRKCNLERQLLQFINACASASMEYSNIIDIFGAIYEQFDNPLRDAIEQCYVEAKKFNDKQIAIKHMEERFDSDQFAFVIDNMELCSATTGDYYTATRSIAATIATYSQSHEKKKAMLRNGKINIAIMFFLSLIIVGSLSVFLGDITDLLFHTTIGNLSLLALFLLFFYGMNLKAEK